MKSIVCSLFLAFSVAVSAQVPSLQKVGNSTCLIVDGKPFVMYCGELHNSTASSLSYMQEHRVWDKLKEMHLNSVIATASWELVEPVEGQYDFTLVDAMIAEARQSKMMHAFSCRKGVPFFSSLGSEKNSICSGGLGGSKPGRCWISIVFHTLTIPVRPSICQKFHTILLAMAVSSCVVALRPHRASRFSANVMSRLARAIARLSP